MVKTYLVIRLRSRKLGEPCRLGIDGDLDRELLVELCEPLRDLELELCELEPDLEWLLLLDDERLLLLWLELQTKLKIFKKTFKLKFEKIFKCCTQF